MTAMTMLLSDLCYFVGMQVDPSSRADQIYYGLEHVTPGRFVATSGGKASDVQSSKYVFQRGDVLYGKLRPYLDKAILAEGAGICTTELLVLRPKEGVDPRFLVGVVHAPSFVEHAVTGTTGVQHPRTSWSHVSGFGLPAFDSEEQAKIAALLWQVHDNLTANEAAIEAGSNLKRAAMAALFTRGLKGEARKETETGPVPESWDVATVGSHFSVASGGTPSRTNPAYWRNGSIPWVKTTEVNYGIIKSTEEFITAEGLANSAAKLLPAGTLLMAMYGQGVTRGRVAILGLEAACNQACAAINVRNDEVLPSYLFHFLTYRYEAIRQMAHGGQQQNLNLEIVRDLPLTFPKDRSHQNEIVAILDAIDCKIDLHKRKRTVLDELFKSLLQKLMTGEIRVGDLDLCALSSPEVEEVAA